MRGFLRFYRFFVEGGCPDSCVKTHKSHIAPLYEETKKTKKVSSRRERIAREAELGG
jgi:hypothetical protein